MADGESSEHLKNRLLILEKEVARLEEELAEGQAEDQRFWSRLKRVATFALLGPRLSRSLGQLLLALREKKEPVFGPSMARVMDSVTLRLAGTRRWLLTAGLLAALPGLISFALLWQQNREVARETINTVADAENLRRLDLLMTVYSVSSTANNAATITPAFSAPTRREAVLDLIKMDRSLLGLDDDPNPTMAEMVESGRIRVVDLANAPLGNTDFSGFGSEKGEIFRDIYFLGSNFYRTNFNGCEFHRVYFGSAALGRTLFRNAAFHDVSFENATVIEGDFTGAIFENCDFTGLKVDQKTLWPEGFDPFSRGAIPFELPNPEGGPP